VITQTAMTRLASERLARAPAGSRTLLAGCLDEERHEVGLRMLCDLLELEGWTASYLGPSVPGPDLVRMVSDRRPDVLALSVSLAPHLLSLRNAIAAIRALDAPWPLILVGGRTFVTYPNLAARVGADLTAADAGQAVRLLRERFP
jgi:MerR family transcriptional regulator, light-induced transcriptional regulator